jgi:cytidylate kinase
MIITKSCPKCGQIFRDHSSKVPIAIRKHIAREHPEIDKEIRDTEREVRRLTRALYDKYPDVFLGL